MSREAHERTQHKRGQQTDSDDETMRCARCLRTTNAAELCSKPIHTRSRVEWNPTIADDDDDDDDQTKAEHEMIAARARLSSSRGTAAAKAASPWMLRELVTDSCALVCSSRSRTLAIGERERACAHERSCRVV